MIRTGVSKRSFSCSVRKLKKKRHEVPTSPEIQEAYDTVAYMTVDDLAIQRNLDQGKQFSFPSEHYLDRKKIIRNLPDEIDLFNSSSINLDMIYNDLQKLDQDKSVQLKYFKKYLRNYDDPINNLIQEFNGINSKFKSLRRNEITSLSLSPSAFYQKENMFNLPYNVIGFDRSISGLPLTSGKNKLSEACYPKEFIEDLQMYRKKIPVYKRDLNFLEFEKDSVNIDPKYLNKRPINNDYDANFNKFLDIIYENEVPEFTIHYENVKQYNLLPPLSEDLYEIFENEIFNLRSQLQTELKEHITKNGSKIMLFANQEIKTNQYKLCEILKPNQLDTSSLLVINYNLKQFNVFPNYSLMLNSKRQVKNLSNHLFKLFLLNLEDQIETIIRIKYHTADDMNKFMDELKATIKTTIKDKIIKSCLESVRQILPPYHLDALIHTISPNSPFKRIYWSDYALYNSVSPRSKSYDNYKRSFMISSTNFERYIRRDVRAPKY